MSNLTAIPFMAAAFALSVFSTSCTKAPVASFTADKTTITEGETVQFTDLSTNDPTIYLWEFSGGTPDVSQDQNPVVSYSTEGVYSVTLEARNRGGSDFMTMNNYITVLPATTDLIFINETHTDVVIELNGITRTAASGEEVTFFDLEGNTVDFVAETSAKTAQNNPIGLELFWDYTIELTGGAQEYPLNVGTDFFFLYVTNNGTHILGPIEVYDGGTEPRVANVSLPTDGNKYRMGYYYTYENAQVRAYYEDDPESYTYWDANVHFSYDNVINQKVELSNPFKKSARSDPGRVATGLELQTPVPAGNPVIPLKYREGAVPHYPSSAK